MAQCPMAVAGMLSGMGRRLAAASAIRSYGSKYDPTGRAAVATPVPATSKLNGAAGGGTAKRGEVVTICLVPAGENPTWASYKRCKNLSDVSCNMESFPVLIPPLLF